MSRQKLPREAIDAALAGLDGWSLAADGASISRRFTFRNFSEAFAFMTRAALAAKNSTTIPTGRTPTRPST